MNESIVAAKPLLILLHGTWANAQDFAPVGELLADICDVAVPDLPGHGIVAHEPYSLAATVRVIEQLVEDAGDRPVIVVGHSLGGFAAMCFAQRHPKTLIGLVLVGSATEPRGVGAAAYQVVGRLVDVVGPKRIAAARRGQRYAPIAPLWQEIIDTCSARQLRDVSCPVLLLGGSLDQLHLGRRSFARTIRHATVVTRRGRTHNWPYRHPHETAHELRTWLTDKVLTARLHRPHADGEGDAGVSAAITSVDA